MIKSFFSSNWLRGFFKASDLCQKQHFWKCKSSFTAHNEARKTQKWKMVIFILKTVIFLELVKGFGASPSHLGLDLLFENRLRRKNGQFLQKLYAYCIEIEHFEKWFDLANCPFFRKKFFECLEKIAWFFLFWP